MASTRPAARARERRNGSNTTRAVPSSATAVAWPSHVILGLPSETGESSAEDRGFGVAGDVTLLYSTEAAVLMFLVFGVLAGSLTGVPIGPVNVAVIDASYRHTMRRALGVALGGAIADSLYA